MPRKRTVEDLKARATTLHARAARERQAALEAQRRVKAAEALARREASLRLGEVVEAVLGPISPERLRVLLATHVRPSPEAASPDASAVPPQGKSRHLSSSTSAERHAAVVVLPQEHAGDTRLPIVTESPAAGAGPSAVHAPDVLPSSVDALLDAVARPSPGSAGLMGSSSSGARHEAAFAPTSQAIVASLSPSQSPPGAGQVSPATYPAREDQR